MPSSSPYETRLRVECCRSNLACCWWAALHGLALASVALALPVASWVKALLGALVAVHAFAARPRRPPALEAHGGGWDLPELGAFNLQLDGSSCVTVWWMRLVLSGQGRRCVVLLVRDQLPAAAWWTLQARVRDGARRRRAAI